MSRQDAYLSGAESDTERKPESTPLPNKQPPTSSNKRSSSKGEVGIKKLTMNLHKIKYLLQILYIKTKKERLPDTTDLSKNRQQYQGFS